MVTRLFLFYSEIFLVDHIYTQQGTLLMENKYNTLGRCLYYLMIECQNTTMSIKT